MSRRESHPAAGPCLCSSRSASLRVLGRGRSNLIHRGQTMVSDGTHERPTRRTWGGALLLASHRAPELTRHGDSRRPFLPTHARTVRCPRPRTLRRALTQRWQGARRVSQEPDCREPRKGVAKQANIFLFPHALPVMIPPATNANNGREPTAAQEKEELGEALTQPPSSLAAGASAFVSCCCFCSAASCSAKNVPSRRLASASASFACRHAAPGGVRGHAPSACTATGPFS